MSNTRANRFNYKKKLEELADHPENQDLKNAAKRFYADFNGEVPGKNNMAKFFLSKSKTL